MAYTVKINQRSLKDKIEATFYQQAKSIAMKNAAQVIDQRKKKFLNDFMSSDVTKEILMGSQDDIGVEDVRGNLFSFIGFEKGSDPIGDLFTFLDNSIFPGAHIDYDKSTKSFTCKR